jgi:Leucine-rich repeat (LRR) protein
LTEIPPDICDLPNLQSIEFEYNKIKRIPADLHKCSNLDYISLNHNRVTFIPPTLGQLKKLEHLRLRWNPIQNVSPDIFHQGLEKTLAYLNQYVPENAHIEESSIRIRILRQLDVPDYSDVIIRSSEGDNFYAHKLVFYCRCRPLYDEILVRSRRVYLCACVCVCFFFSS